MILVPFKSWDHLLSKTSKIIEIENVTAEQRWFEICKVENSGTYASESFWDDLVDPQVDTGWLQ